MKNFWLDRKNAAYKTNRSAQYDKAQSAYLSDETVRAWFDEVVDKSLAMLPAADVEKIDSLCGLGNNVKFYLLQLGLFGDLFLEKFRDVNYKLCRIRYLIPGNTYRIETIKGKLLEFQNSKEGPDYATIGSQLSSVIPGKPIRFKPEAINHVRIGGNSFGYGTPLSCHSDVNKAAELLANVFLEKVKDILEEK